MTADPNRLHPDGAPGVAETKAREMFGDVAFEADRDMRMHLAAVQSLTASAKLDRAKADADVRWQQSWLLWAAGWAAAVCIPALTIAVCWAVLT